MPKCYLENFTDNDGFVWVLDTKDNIFRIKPENILLENHFYTITLKNGEKSLVVEDTLSNIEGAYISIFQNKIEKDLPLNDQERAKVAVFVAALYIRTSPYREGLREALGTLRSGMEDWKKQFETMSEKSKRAMAAIPSSGKGESISIDDLNKYLGNFNEHHSINVIEQLPEIAQIIFDMKWSIWVDANNNFVTSDDPVVLLRPESIKKYGVNALGSRPGLLYKDTELTLPLSKDRLLLAGWILNKNSYLDVPDDIVQKINHRTITGSSNRVITKSQKDAETIRNKYTETKEKKSTLSN
ncbi:MAG: DUF4238 domain-containing protein [Candidatus Nomurabacteria bacterium]|nr:DUF4238 domain-containing protein [Candidatus Nomurabacteria bacterium]